MSRREAWVAVAVLACVAVSGCRQAGEEKTDAAKPVKVEKAAGKPAKLTLTDRAVERLGLLTAPVRKATLKSARPGGATGIAIPYTALLFDKKGQAAAYLVVGPRVFTRSPVVVDHYDGDLVVLASGLAVGARVVTDGSAELSGAEAGLS
jgi:hypothetical protein